MTTNIVTNISQKKISALRAAGAVAPDPVHFFISKVKFANELAHAR